MRRRLIFFLIIILTFMLGVLLLRYDQVWSDWARSLPHAHSVGTFWGWADKYGEWPTWIVVILCLVGYLISPEKWTKYRPYLLFILAVALISPIILNRSLKAIIHRPRPILDYTIPDSFPSGHTASAFLLFAFTYLVPKDKKALKIMIGIGLGLWGLAVGISRIVWGAHYPSDVLGGAFLTLMTEYVLWRLVFRRRIENSHPPQLD